jgi:hypothetical protein
MMKKYLAGALVLLLAGTGCFGSDESTPLTPGDLDDPDFQIFMDEFETIDDGNGLMVESMFEMIDGIFNSAPGTPPQVSGEFQVSFEYSELEGHWVGSLQGTDPEEGITFSLVHTIQFIENGSAVQYPNPDLLERINSTTEMDLTGEGINSAGGTQNMTIDIEHHPEDVLLTLNGDGTAALDITHVEVTEAGTQTCDVALSFSASVSDLLMWGSSDGCPVGGSISYHGGAEIACIDDSGTTDVSGSWSVNRTYDETGTATTRVANGSNVWEVEEACF